MQSHTTQPVTQKKRYGIAKMALQLQDISIVAPGFKGINTEDSPLAQEASFADVADNTIIDRSGRMASRKGRTLLTTTDTELNNQPVNAIGKYKDDAGNAKLFFVGNNKILSGAVTIVDETPGAYTITADEWKIVNFNDNLYFFQSAHEPLVYNNALGAVTKMSSIAGSVGVTSAMYGNEVIGAWGRLWTANMAADKSTIYWSDLQLGAQWSGGSSGSIDISDSWPDGHDEIVGLAAHNSLLIIFGRHSIVTYSGADSPSTMAIQDTITGVGCVGRDSIQYTGIDLLFLSDTGLRSLGRTIQEKSMPLTERSLHVKTQMTAYIQTETLAYRAVYSPENGFYLLHFQDIGVTYCFDLRGELDDGSYRVTRWTGTIFDSFFRDKDDGTLYMGTTEGICTYSGYTDNGAKYRFRYSSPSLSFGDSSRLKFLKKIKPTLVGGNGETAIVSWAYDFAQTKAFASFPVGNESTAFYGIDEYNIAEYNSGALATRKSINANGSGEVIAISFEIDITGFPVSLQELNILATIGKVT